MTSVTSRDVLRRYQRPRHEPLEGLEGDAYLNKKAEHCKECYAWMFFSWLKDRNYDRDDHAQMASRELVARIRGSIRSALRIFPKRDPLSLKAEAARDLDPWRRNRAHGGAAVERPASGFPPGGANFN